MVIHSLQVWFHYYYYYYNLIPWCQFKEMDQGHEMSFLILNREVKRMFFCLNRMKVWRPFGNKPYPNFPSVFPTRIPAIPGNFNTIKLNISSTVIKFCLWQNYQIIQNNLPQLGTWILDLWNPHIMKFELIGSRNLHNKIRGNA